MIIFNTKGHYKSYPVLKVKDIYYAQIYGWLNTIFEEADTVLFRPESGLGNAR